MRRLLPFLLAAVCFAQKVDLGTQTKGVLQPEKFISGTRYANGCLTMNSGATGVIVSQNCPSIDLRTNGTLNGSQRVLNLAQGSGIVLTDAGNGTVTIATTGGVSGVSGSGSTNTIPVWTGTSALGNSILFQNPSGIATSELDIVGSAAAIVQTPVGGSSFVIQSSSTSTGTAASLYLLSGSVTGAGTGGNVWIATPSPASGTNYGAIVLHPGLGGSGGSLNGTHVVVDRYVGTSYNTAMIELTPRNALSSPRIMWGTSSPTSWDSGSPINCGSGTTPTLYLKGSPSSASDFLWVCISGTTWTALAVP